MALMRKLKNTLRKNMSSLLKMAGFSLLSRGGHFIKQSAAQFLQPDTEQTDWQFEQAMQEYQLTEADLRRKSKQLHKQCLIYFCLAIGVFFYGCYSLSLRSFYVFLVTTLLTIMLFAFAFRAHFWMFQIKQRRLGCSYKDWLAAVLNGEP